MAQQAVAHMPDGAEKEKKFESVKSSMKVFLRHNPSAMQNHSQLNPFRGTTAGPPPLLPLGLPAPLPMFQLPLQTAAGAPLNPASLLSPSAAVAVAAAAAASASASPSPTLPINPAKALEHAQNIARSIEKGHGTLITPSSASAVSSGSSSIPATATMVGQVPGLGPNGYIDTATGNSIDEFEINDYPQQARQKITQKDVLNRIADDSGTICQVKGQYIVPDGQPSQFAAAAAAAGAAAGGGAAGATLVANLFAAASLGGGKKLYIEIIGPTPVSIQRAKHEIRMLMESISVRQLNAQQQSQQKPTGRYTVC
eukprot:Selendium_serpulae@DN3459_c0_g1_i1.p1